MTQERRRVIGTLRASRRGPVLEAEDGAIWALNLAPDTRIVFDERIIVEGVKAGLDRLDVDWIGEQ